MSSDRIMMNKKLCSCILVFFLFFSLFPPNSQASLVESRLSTGEQVLEKEQHIESIRGALEHKLVAQKLKDYGLSQEEVIARMENMDEQQLHQLASLSDEIGGAVIGVIAAAVLVLTLIYLILRITGRR